MILLAEINLSSDSCKILLLYAVFLIRTVYRRGEVLSSALGRSNELLPILNIISPQVKFLSCRIRNRARMHFAGKEN